MKIICPHCNRELDTNKIKRDKILYLSSKPISATKLKDKLNISWGSFYYHLNYLIKQGKVKKTITKINGKSKRGEEVTILRLR